MASPALRPRGRTRSRTLATLLALVALCCGVGASQASALPADFWGVAAQATPTPEEFQRLKRGGVDSLRVPIAWGSVQQTRGGALDWSTVDPLVSGAVAAGIDVLPFVYGAPTWAVAHDRRYGSPVTLPVKSAKQRSAWTAFLREAVARYGPNGSFWSEHTALPDRPVRTWQLWNEQNFEYFVARPNPADYGKLVKISYAAIRGEDPGAKMILGGMFARPKEATFRRRPKLAYFAADFLQRMYRSTPGVKSKFQGVALHPYTTTYKRLKPYIEEFRRVLSRNHDAGKGLWITELGWSSGHPTANNHFAKGRAGQAAQLRAAFRLIRQNQRKWRVQRVYWFSVDDQAGACNFCDGSGLFGEGFLPKPSWYAYVGFAGGTP
jgi:polysaccharide biosynthesis protein PslG